MNIPDFQGDPGPLLDKLNRLVAAANALQELRGDEVFIAVRKTPQGYTIALNMDRVLARIPKTNSSAIFPVRLQNPTGSAGSASAACNYTYDVYQLDNTTLIDSGISVIDGGSGPRMVLCTVLTAADHGEAYYDLDDDGNPVLTIMWCNELAYQTNCG